MKRSSTLSRVFWLAVALIISACATQKKDAERWRTANITRGNIEEKVSSSGNLRAVGTVSVLAQVTGTLDEVYVDYNDHVKKGDILARINTDKLKIALKEAEATLERVRAQYAYNERSYQQNKQLKAQGLISEDEFEEKRLSFLSTRSSLIQAEAAEENARLNIEAYATILSPIDGTVLARLVEKGQTVVGSANSNSELFILAEDLKAMEIEVKVDELDISRISLGQRTRFTAEAWPSRSYSGNVRQIRKMPTVSNNVVSYTVIVAAENPDKSLLPGMTALVDFIINERQDVLRIPNAALHFSPPAETNVKEKKSATESNTSGSRNLLGTGTANTGGMMRSAFAPRSMGGRQNPGGSTGASNGSQNGTEKMGEIWLLESEGKLTAYTVRTGIQDALYTELIDADALLGKPVITRAILSP